MAPSLISSSIIHVIVCLMLVTLLPTAMPTVVPNFHLKSLIFLHVKATCTREHVEARVVHIVASQLGFRDEDVPTDAIFINDLGADELDLIEIKMALEVEFNVDIKEEEWNRIHTVAAAVNLIRIKC